MALCWKCLLGPHDTKHLKFLFLQHKLISQTMPLKNPYKSVSLAKRKDIDNVPKKMPKCCKESQLNNIQCV